MGSRVAVRQVDIRRAMQAVESGGGSVRAVEIEPNGVIRILTGAPPERVSDADQTGGWADVAGETEISRA